MVEREGGLEVSDRLAIREDRMCSLGGLEERVRGFRRSTRLVFMECDQRISSDIVSGAGRFEPERVGRPPVEQASSRQADPVVGGIAQVAVAEVEPDRFAGGVCDLADEAAPDKSFEGVDRLLLDRPLAWRAVPASNERPMTAAAVRICAAASPTDAIRSRNNAWTPRGIYAPGSAHSPGAPRRKGQSLGIGDDGVDVGVVGEGPWPRGADHRG